MTRDARLPDRCVRCNGPSMEAGFECTLYWHPRVWFWLLLVPPLYLLVAVWVQRSIKVALGLCETHQQQLRRTLSLAHLLTGGGMALLLLLSVAAELGVRADQAATVLGGLMCLAGLVLLAAGSRVCGIQRIDGRIVRLTKVNRAFLSELPAWAERTG